MLIFQTSKGNENWLEKSVSSRNGSNVTVYVWTEPGRKLLLVRVIIKVQKIAKTSRNQDSIEYKFKFGILFGLMIITSRLIDKNKCCTVSQTFKFGTKLGCCNGSFAYIWTSRGHVTWLIRSPKSCLLFLFLSSNAKCAFLLYYIIIVAQICRSDIASYSTKQLSIWINVWYLR